MVRQPSCPNFTPSEYQKTKNPWKPPPQLLLAREVSWSSHRAPARIKGQGRGAAGERCAWAALPGVETPHITARLYSERGRKKPGPQAVRDLLCSAQARRSREATQRGFIKQELGQSTEVKTRLANSGNWNLF